MSEMSTNDRGFYQIEPFETHYHGKMRVQESSSAERPCLFIFSDHGYGTENATFHLTYKDAEKLQEQLAIMIPQLKRNWGIKDNE